MNWFDAIIIAVLLIFMAFGIKKGFMFSVIDMFGFFVNFVIAAFLSGPIRSLLGVMGMEGGIAGSLHGHYAGLGSGFTTNLISDVPRGSVSDFVTQTIEGSSMSGFGKKLFNGAINNNLAEKINASQEAGKSSLTLADIMSKSLAQFITVVTAFIVSFILVYAVLLILKVISKKLQQLSFANVFDKIFGGVFGIVRGFMFWVFIFAILSFFSDNGLLSTVIGYINKSAIGGWLRTSVNTFMVSYVNIKQFLIDFLQKL